MNLTARSIRSAPLCEKHIFRGIMLFAFLLIITSPIPLFGKAIQTLMNFGGMKCPNLIPTLSTFSDYVYFSVLVQLLFGIALIPIAAVCLTLLKPLSLGCRLTTVLFFSCATIFAFSLLLSTL